MKRHLFRIWFMGLLCINSPGQSEAEMIRAGEKAHLRDRAFHPTAGMTETRHWKKQKSEKRKGNRGEGRKANHKGLIIISIVLLSIGVIVFGSLGLVYLALAFELAGDSLATIGLVLGIAGLALGLLCAVRLFKQVRKLKKLNRGEESNEVIQRRSPTRIINQ